MAAADIQQPLSFSAIDGIDNPVQVASFQQTRPEKHNVQTILNYHKDNEDGSPPRPSYVGQPETYDRPVSPHTVTIHDVTGQESEYTLDKNGFQFHRHTASEKEFLDDEEIKKGYYAETEQLLKDV
jgi:hypothetical protein